MSHKCDDVIQIIRSNGIYLGRRVCKILEIMEYSCSSSICTLDDGGIAEIEITMQTIFGAPDFFSTLSDREKFE